MRANVVLAKAQLRCIFANNKERLPTPLIAFLNRASQVRILPGALEKAQVRAATGEAGSEAVRVQFEWLASIETPRDTLTIETPCVRHGTALFKVIVLP